MALTFHFLEEPAAESLVLGWFRALTIPPEETSTPQALVLYFRQLGPLIQTEGGNIDATRSPVARVVLPEVRRGALWTVGEVNFFASLSLPENKGIRDIARSFTRWMKGHALAHQQSLKAKNPFAYYLEGSSQNWGDIYALPSGSAALKRGQYFVSARDNDFVLETVCRTLRLRGVDCGPP